MINFFDVFSQLKKGMGKDFKIKLIVAVGLLGMLFILLAQMRSNAREPVQTSPQQSPANIEYITEDEYAQQLETKLQALIGSVDGVGRVEVMITLEHGVEYIYALEEKSSMDKTTEAGTEESSVIDYKHNVEYNYVFVDSGYGEKQPLVKTKVPPKVQGVVIVCDGADNARVQQNVLNVVTTALHIPTTRVCVVKINAN